jgi:hypothetical protein
VADQPDRLSNLSRQETSLIRCRKRHKILLFGAMVGALEAPRERLVLTLSSKIEITYGAGAAHFGMKLLQALPQHSFTTKTPWPQPPGQVHRAWAGRCAGGH